MGCFCSKVPEPEGFTQYNAVAPLNEALDIMISPVQTLTTNVFEKQNSTSYNLL